MSPMICYLGIEALSYGFEKVVADKALILIACVIFVLAVVTLLGTIYAKINVLIFIVYMNLVVVVFVSIFAIGCVTFQANMETWIYENWGEIREKTSKLNIDQFRENFVDSLISLGFFSFTISIGLIISNVSILLWIPFNRFLESVISSFSIIFIVFSSATIVITFQTKEALDIWFQITDSDEWASYFAIVVSFLWTFIGILGYYASLKNHQRLLMIYLGSMILTNLILFAFGLGLIIFSYNIDSEVSEKWTDIQKYLTEIGEEVPIEIFTEDLDEVVKFGGLYGLAFFIFNVIGIAASSYQLRKIYRKEEIK